MNKETSDLILAIIVSVSAVVGAVLVVRAGGMLGLKTWFISLSAKGSEQPATQVSDISSKKGNVSVKVSGEGHRLTASQIQADKNVNIENRADSGK